MKNNIKIIVAFIIGMLLSGTVVYATLTYSASQITYTKPNNQEVTLDSALDELYSASLSSGVRICKYVGNDYGNSNDHLSLGTEYECDVNLNNTGKKNFYVLNVTGDTVTLIMKQNITQNTSKTSYTWNDAVKYVKAMTWKVKAELPKVQDIADAVGNTSWKEEDKVSSNWFCFGGSFGQGCGSNSGTLKNDNNVIKNRWLFNYIRECTNSGCDSTTSLGEGEANGYWTRDIVAQEDSNLVNRAWVLTYQASIGCVELTRNSGITYGVRPVISVLKSNLYE